MKKNDFPVMSFIASRLAVLWVLVLLSGCGRPPMEVLRAHDVSVAETLFSPDGRVLATSGTDGKIVLWDVATRRPLHTLMPGPKGGARFLSFSHDSHTLVAPDFWESYDSFTLWDVGSGRMKGTLERSPFILPSFLSSGVQGRPGAALWGPATWEEKSTQMRDYRRREEEHLRSRLRITFSSQHRASAFSPDGKLLATIYNGKTLTLWDGETGRFQKLIDLWAKPQPSTFIPPATGVPVPPPPPAGSKRGFLVAGSSDSTTVAWLGNRRVLVVARGTRRGEGASQVDVCQLDVRTGETLWKIGFDMSMGKKGFEPTPSVIAVSWDGKMLARNWYRLNTTRRFRLRSMRIVKRTTIESAVVLLYPESEKKPLEFGRRSSSIDEIAITSISFSPDGRRLAAGSADGLVRLWDLGPTAGPPASRGEAPPAPENPPVAVAPSATPETTQALSTKPAASPRQTPVPEPITRQSVQPSPTTVRVGGIIKAPHRVRDAQPVFSEAIAPGTSGSVILQLTVGPKGKIVNVEIVSGAADSSINQAIVAAAWKWEYTPTLLNGVPVSVIMTVPVPYGAVEE